MSTSLCRERLGLLRSLAMYYGVPGRHRRMQRFYGQFIQPNSLCFDIGSHVGNRLRVWSALGARMVALEPQPHLMRCLRHFYGGRADIVLLEEAVGAQPGSATLHISRRTPTVTSLSSEWIATMQRDPSFAGVHWDAEVTVPVTTLDALIERYGRPDFCKIDVEGYELDVLQGLSQPVATLSFEYVAAALPLAQACLERLAMLGDYEFNSSAGESHHLQSKHWLSTPAMLAVLNGIEKGSGDVYARLRQADTRG